MWVSDPFDQYASRYEAWFQRNRNAYAAEVRAVRQLMPSGGRTLEIGVGTGRFASPLGIRFGVDPSLTMLRLARQRGVDVVIGFGEALPFSDSSFDVALMVTTVCFLDDIHLAFLEARRVLRPKGWIIVGLVDKKSPLGRVYLERREESVFYSLAEFYSVAEIVASLSGAGFHKFHYRQTLFGHPKETSSSEPIMCGYGEGSFAVVRASVSGG